MKVRRVVSLTAAISFLIMLLTSIVLFIVPEGRVAHWADWRLLGMNKEEWADIHTNLGFLFLATLSFHLYFNWRAITTYLKTRSREFRLFTREFSTALVLVFLCFGGTYYYVAPFSSVLEFSASIKRQAAFEYGEPPFSGAQRASLESFTQRLGLDLDAGLQELNRKGFEVNDTSLSMIQLAENNGTTPQQIYLAMLPVLTEEEMKETADLIIPTSGFGKFTLAELSQHYGVDSGQVLAGLNQSGTVITQEMKLKEMGELLNESPRDLFEQFTGLNTGDE